MIIPLASRFSIVTFGVFEISYHKRANLQLNNAVPCSRLIPSAGNPQEEGGHEPVPVPAAAVAAAVAAVVAAEAIAAPATST